MYYLVSYDLKDASTEEYDRLKKAIRKMNGVSILESVWVLYRKKSSAESVAKILNLKIDTNRGDELVVVCFGDNLSTQHFSWTGFRTILHVLKKLKKVH